MPALRAGERIGSADEVNTFSIVAFDPDKKEWGVAVASKYLAVGSVVPWAKAGVGAVATQAQVNATYGPKGLDLLAEARLLVGTPAPRVLKAEAVLPEPEIGAERLQDESLILKSRAIARQVTDKLHLAGVLLSRAWNSLAKPH